MQEAGLNQCFSASLVIFKFFYKDVYGDRRYPMALSNRDDKWSSLAVKHTLQLSLIFTSKVHCPPWSQLHFTEKSEAKKCQPIKQGNIPLATIFCFKKNYNKKERLHGSVQSLPVPTSKQKHIKILFKQWIFLKLQALKLNSTLEGEIEQGAKHL